MNEQQAIELVKQTFKSEFDKSRFAKFIKELLNSADFDTSFSHRGQYIYDDFQKDISLFERIAKYSDGENEIDVLIVHLKKDSTIERARTMQRNFIAKYLDKKNRKAALVAFVSPNPEDWRFSLVKMEYGFKERPDGTPKAVTELTPAKRWSFLVGAHEKSHTAQRQFQPILKDENDPTLEQLEAAFNIEKVTDDFFKEYRRLFIDTKVALDKAVKANPKTKADFESKGIDTVNLAKKLLGQIVFLYYLQKKGWFGVPKDGKWGQGKKNFLRELFEKKYGAYEDFFNDILEPLFYEALRIDRSEKNYFYERFNCKIPFLNGGLFDPMGNYDWDKTTINLSNTLFSHKTKDNPEGDGILDVFDLYNFTVNEDEPYEKEVAIDPELLGKAYEKFNAIRPDNYDEFVKALNSGKKGDESKFNKQYGVYYTPREIVHYMCQQSLINYLYSELNPNVIYQSLGDDKLDMFGNAVKSGQLDLTAEHRLMTEIPKEDIATLILKGEQIKEHDARVVAEGRETRDYPFLMPESIRNNTALIDEKLANIKVCDPAVGSGAFPVGMMSEIVRARDVLKIWTKTKKTVYDFKRGCIENSLYGVDIDAGAVEIAKLRLWLSLIVDEDDIQNIKPLPNLDYKVVCGNSLVGLPEGILLDLDIKAKLEERKRQYFYLTKPNEKNQKRDEINELFSQLVESARQFDPTLGNINFDFHTHFSEVFHGENRFDVIIGNPPWGAKLSAKEKVFLKENFSEIDSSTPNSFAYFIGLTSKISKGNIAYVLPDSLLIKDFAKTRKSLTPNLSQLLWYQNIGIPDVQKPFVNVEHDVCVIISDNNKSDVLFCSKTFYNYQAKELLTETWTAQKSQMIFDEFDSVFNLMLRQADLTILKKIQAFPAINSMVQCHEGIHTGNSRDILFKAKKENEWCKPLYYGAGNGDTISNWVSEKPMWYVDYRSDLIDKKAGHYASLRDERIFKLPKIYITRTGNPFKAFIDENNYASNNFFSLQLKDYKKNEPDLLKIILPFILSPLAQYFVRTFAAPRLGDTFIETKITHLLKFTIPELSHLNKENLLRLANRILTAKAKNPKANTEDLERQIDLLVYELYGLTQDEIKIIEGE